MNNKQIAEMIADRVIAEMEKGVVPWHKPSISTGYAYSHTTGKPYSFVNQFFMPPGEYITFNQCKAEGGSVKKGAIGQPIFFWKVWEKEKETDDGEKVIEKIPVLRYYTVFNLNDCTGIKQKYEKPLSYEHNPIDKAEKVSEAYLTAQNITVLSGYNEARYSPTRDQITIPALEQYKNSAEYYSTLFHEITHSTGHPSRLNRIKSGTAAAFGGENYSKEELIAEIGAAACLDYCGIDNKDAFDNSVSYLNSWLSALKKDKTLLLYAAGKAQKAFELITSYS